MLPPAKNSADMQSVVTNSTVDGVLAALFAMLIIIVILDASRVWVKAIRAREPLPTTEAPAVPARIVAPAGLFWTREERALLDGDGATVTAGSGRFERDDAAAERETAGRAP